MELLNIARTRALITNRWLKEPCLQENEGEIERQQRQGFSSRIMAWVNRTIFVYNVTTGLYMLDWWERYLFSILFRWSNSPLSSLLHLRALYWQYPVFQAFKVGSKIKCNHRRRCRSFEICAQLGCFASISCSWMVHIMSLSLSILLQHVLVC
jgi:hypothetical protein